MSKPKDPGALAIRDAAKSAGLLARKLGQLDEAAKAIEDAPATARKSLRLISAPATGIQALVTDGLTTIRIEGGVFSVEVAEKED